MPTWKLNIFVRAIKKRMTDENRTAEDVVSDYAALTAEEKAAILTAIQEG